VFANVVFKRHDELHVLSNLLPLPSVIGGGILAYSNLHATTIPISALF
jgi:hypothetical protein